MYSWSHGQIVTRSFGHMSTRTQSDTVSCSLGSMTTDAQRTKVPRFKVSLDEDLYELFRASAFEQRRPITRAVNDVLRVAIENLEELTRLNEERYAKETGAQAQS